jgi:hypothetical protein
MATILHADITALLDALTASDEQGVIQQTLNLLAENVPPSQLAARVAIPAAWAAGDGHALLVLGAAGRVAEWMRSIPVSPEPGSDEYKLYAPARPLVQGFLAVAGQVDVGLKQSHPPLPDPLTPFEVEQQLGTNSMDAMRAAFASLDRDRFTRLLLGFYRVGADYRTLLAHLYATLEYRYPAGGHPLTFAVGSGRVLDMADWGDRVPPFIYWLQAQVLGREADESFAGVVRDFAGQPENDLGWVQKRLTPAKEDVAGAQFRRSVIEGNTAIACSAVLKALRDGASPRGVASALALTSAEQLLGIPEGDVVTLERAAHALLYAHSVHIAMLQVQNPEVLPLLYMSAAAVNAMPKAETEPPRAAPASTPLGGLIAPALLRSFEHQIASGDAPGALSTARRYVQMGHPPRSLAGVMGNAAARRDPRRGGLHALPLVAAAAEEYVTQPGITWLSVTNQAAGQSALLSAAIRLATELPGDARLSDQVEEAIARRIRKA